MSALAGRAGLGQVLGLYVLLKLVLGHNLLTRGANIFKTVPNIFTSVVFSHLTHVAHKLSVQKKVIFLALLGVGALAFYHMLREVSTNIFVKYFGYDVFENTFALSF